MEKINFTIEIAATREKVWNTMLEDVTYRQWTAPFSQGSFFEGSWEEGTEIRFKGIDENGDVSTSGMYSKIKENRLYEFISIEHLGMIIDGVVDTTSEEVKKWTPAFENYSFVEIEGGTKLSVEMDISPEYKTEFEKMWPEALQLLKELAEK